MDGLHAPGSLVFLIVLVLLLAFMSGGATLSSGNLGNLGRQIALNAPVALAQMVALLVGGMDLSVGAVLAMSSALAVGLQPFGLWPAVLGAVLFGTGIGAVNGLLVTRAHVNPFIVTLGTMNLVTGALLTYTNQQPIAGQIPAFTELGGGWVGVIPTPVVIMAVISVLLHLLLAYTRVGRNLYAVGGNAEAAFLSGISVGSHNFLAYVVAGTLSGVAGVLLASSLNSGSIQVGANAALLSISAAIIGGSSMFGGRGGVGGALIGITVLGVLANGLNALGVFTYYQIGITAVILIVVVVFDALNRKLAGRTSLALIIRGMRPTRKEVARWREP
jgi:ribose transport system permease protein